MQQRETLLPLLGSFLEEQADMDRPSIRLDDGPGRQTLAWETPHCLSSLRRNRPLLLACGFLLNQGGPVGRPAGWDCQRRGQGWEGALGARGGAGSLLLSVWLVLAKDRKEPPCSGGSPPVLVGCSCVRSAPGALPWERATLNRALGNF